MGYDYLRTNMGKQLTGLYYYILNNEDTTNENCSIYGYVPTVQNICFNPMLEKEDITAVQCDFDKAFYKFTNNLAPKVYRIQSFSRFTKTLGEYNITSDYEFYGSNYPSKLLCYPYRYFILTDYINPPLVIQPQLMYNNNGKWTFKVKVALSQTSKYNLFAYGYKNDFNGNLEGIVNNNPFLYPVSSNQYASWLMSNGNTFSTTNNYALMENDLSLQQGTQQTNMSIMRNNLDTGLGIGGGIINAIGGGIGGFAGGGVKGAITGALSGVGQAMTSGLYGYANHQQLELNQSHLNQSHALKEQQIEQLALARQKDYLNTPRAIKSVGNDGIFAMENASYKVDLIEYGMKDNRLTRIYSYFDRYGYRINKYTQPNFTSKKYWNYIKTVNCDIDSSQIPHGDLQAIQNIFNSGITFWHIDNGAEVKDYTKKNTFK